MRNLDGKPGFTLEIYLEPSSAKTRTHLDTIQMESSNVFLIDYKHPKLKGALFYADLKGTFTPEEDGTYDFGLTCHGTTRMFIDGKLVIDNTENQKPGDTFFGAGTEEVKGSMNLKAGQVYDIYVEFGSGPTAKTSVPGVTSLGAGGFILGGTKRVDAEEEVAKAVALAKEVDQVVICAGLNVSEFFQPLLAVLPTLAMTMLT
jgi:beta-glucosidase